jgi:fused signal recognition particle receptor
MFGKLREKLKSWTKKVSIEAEEKPEKEVIEKPEQVLEEKEIKLPTEFSPATQKYEPDLEKLQETVEELEQAKRDIKKVKKTEELKEKTQEIEKKEIEKEQDKPGKKGFFKKITSKISKVTISEKAFEIYSEDLKMLLLENNVAFEVAEKLINRLKEEIVGKELLKKEVEEEIIDCLKNIIREILIEPFNIYEKIKEKQDPYVMIFCGINGTGKTTTIAKIAHHLQKQGLTCVLAAADTFRAASIEQIKKHADKLNIKVIAHDYGTDPAAVAFDAVQYAKKNKIDAVLIDTAGRMHSEKNLLKELEKISRVNKPDLKLFIGEAITGNDSIEQAKSFDWAIGIDGIILTKADTDEKGGTALSLGHVIKKPILYLGTGQEYEDITPFDKNKFIEELGL